MRNQTPIGAIAGVVCLTVLSFCSAVRGNAQGPAADIEKTANPELVGQLTKSLSMVGASVPGIEGLIKSAPAAA